MKAIGLTRFVRLVRSFIEGRARPFARDTWSFYRHHHTPCRERLGVTGDVSGATGVSWDQRETLPKQIVCRDTSPATSRRSWHRAVTVAIAPGVSGDQDLRCHPLKLLTNSESRVSPYSLHPHPPWSSSSRQCNRRLNAETDW